MKKCVFFAAMLLLAACSSDNGEELNVKSEDLGVTDAEVTLNFCPYEMSAMTRAATSISGIVNHLDVWFYENGSEVAAVHQSSSDDGFGTVTVSLNRLKTYTLYAVGHKANGAATLADGIISFPEDKVTHAMVYTTTFCPGTTASLNCLMTRIVGMLRFEITDAVPDDAYTVQFALGSSFTRWNITSSIGTNAIDRVASFSNFSRANDGSVTFSIYILPTNLSDTDQMDITVTALKQNGDEIESKSFENVPIKAGYRTTYRGQFFTTEGVTGSFTVDDWSEFDVIAY